MGWNEAELLRWLARRRARPALVGSQGHDAAVLRPARGPPGRVRGPGGRGRARRSGDERTRARPQGGGRALSDLAATPRGRSRCSCASRRRARNERSACARVIEGRGREGARARRGARRRRLSRRRAAARAVRHGARRRSPAAAGRRGATARGRASSCSSSGSVRRQRARAAPRAATRASPSAELLRAHGARALMDVSDGLRARSRAAGAASGVRIDLEHVPLHPDARARRARRADAAAREHALTTARTTSCSRRSRRAPGGVRAAARRRFPDARRDRARARGQRTVLGARRGRRRARAVGRTRRLDPWRMSAATSSAGTRGRGARDDRGCRRAPRPALVPGALRRARRRARQRQDDVTCAGSRAGSDVTERSSRRPSRACASCPGA
jgi:hypothetical protein